MNFLNLEVRGQSVTQETWILALQDTLLGIQDYKKVKFQDEIVKELTFYAEIKLNFILEKFKNLKFLNNCETIIFVQSFPRIDTPGPNFFYKTVGNKLISFFYVFTTDAHMGDVDSAVAKQRIEDKGKDIDALSDYMDRLVDSRGNLANKDIFLHLQKHPKVPRKNTKRTQNRNAYSLKCYGD